MERRWSERVPLSSNVVMICHGEKTYGRIKDINLEGMFVETDGPVCEKVEEVELHFGERPEEICRLPANAVHRSEKGVGLQLQFTDQDSFRRVRDLWIHETDEQNVLSS